MERSGGRRLERRPQNTARTPAATPIVGLAADEAIRETLEVLAEDVIAHTGFRTVVIAVRSSETALTTIVAAGDERVRASLLDSVMPLAALDALCQVSQPWGNLHFVADASAHPAVIDGAWSWADETPGRGDADPGSPEQWWTERRWEKENVLFAPLLTPDADVLGLLSVDLPSSGLRPDEAQRMALSVYAHQAERTIAAAARRTSATHQLALAEAARLIVREAGLQHHVSELLPRARAALLSNFALQQAWIKSSDAGALRAGHLEGVPLMAPEFGSQDALPEGLVSSLSKAAQHCWQHQEVLEVSAMTQSVPAMERAEVEELLRFLAAHGVASALVVPLGSGDTRLGSMVLGRSQTGRAWSSAEKSVALDIGHDIGRSMVHTLWFEAQQAATEELRQAADYKRELLMTMSHELQTPLASIQAHAELVAEDVAGDDTVHRALSAIGRGSHRLTKLVNNMLWLARVDDPRRAVDTELVDLVETVWLVAEDAALPDVVRLCAGQPTGPPQGHGRDLVVDVPDEPVWVAGTHSELVLLWCNLVANALAYTNEGGLVHVQLTADDTSAELTVTDDGIGIAPEDLDHVFEDFYRSSAPAVRQRTGTGLGLGIVTRIATRHGGHVTVESTPGATRFSVVLPLSSVASLR